MVKIQKKLGSQKNNIKMRFYVYGIGYIFQIHIHEDLI
jgi:hypothetical protein